MLWRRARQGQTAWVRSERVLDAAISGALALAAAHGWQSGRHDR
jgi:hypothetical protein